MVVEKFQRFTEPVPMQKRGGARPWYEASAEELEQFRQHLPDTPPICHDLSVLEAPLGEEWLASNTVLLGGAVPQSDTSPGEGYLDEMAVRMADEDA